MIKYLKNANFNWFELFKSILGGIELCAQQNMCEFFNFLLISVFFSYYMCIYQSKPHTKAVLFNFKVFKNSHVSIHIKYSKLNASRNTSVIIISASVSWGNSQLQAGFDGNVSITVVVFILSLFFTLSIQ